jgi:iron complex transport system substrate-binding protein
MMRRMLLIVSLAVSLCAHPLFAAPGPYTVTDTLGRSLSFQKIPARIVIAGRATLLLMDAVYLFPGVSQRVVAVGGTDQGLGDFLPLIDRGAAAKPRFTNSVGAEQIAAVRPDLVILKSYLKGQLGDALERIGIPVLYLDLESPEKFYADVQTLGRLFQQPERAHFIEDWYRSRVEAVTRATAAAERPSVLVVQYNARDGTNAFTVPPAGWIQTVTTETAGGAPVWKDAGPGDGWKKVGLEQLSAWNPRYVFVISYGKPSGPVAEDIRSSGSLAGTIAGFPSDFYSWDQADTRWILGLEWMAMTLHPALFPELDMRGEVREFFSRLYGIDEATLRSEIFPRLENAFAPR